MERKTRSGKVSIVLTTQGVVTGKKKGRKKKTDIEESDKVENNVVLNTRRSTRGRNPEDSIPSQSSSKSFTDDVEDAVASDEKLNEDQNPLEIVATASVDNPPETTLREADETSTHVTEETITLTITETLSESTTEQVLEIQCEEVHDSIPSEDIVSSPIPEQLIKLEQQMSDVLLGDAIQLKSERDDVIMEEEQNKSRVDQNPIDVKDSTDSAPIEVKEEKVEAKIETFEELMDIEDDAPFVRRSRRLKSIHIETFAIKNEDNASALYSASSTASSLEKKVTQMPPVDFNLPAIEMELNSEVLKQEETVKTIQEVRTKVEHTDIRLKRYETIRDNIYSKKSDKKVCKVNKTMKCDCTITEEEVKNGEVGCQYNCINRILYIECGLKCRCGEYCDNQQFQRYNYAGCSVFETTNKGFGIRADRDIPAETFIIEYVGEVLDNKQFEKRAKKYSENKNIHYYFMALKSNAIIDATKKGNISRFINHSCDPNAETQKWTVNGELRVGFFSRKDIKQNDEITFDYQYQRYGKEAQQCYCEAPNCRGWIGENPLDDEEGDEEEVIESPEVDESKPKKTKARKGRKPKATQDKLQPELELGGDSSLRGDSESEEDAKVSKKQEASRKLSSKLEKRQELFDDLEIKGEISALTSSGLKNRAHTIRLSRVIVRVKNVDAKSRLLQILINGDLPCRRLFLDYNGLKLLHNWMCDINVNKTSLPDLGLSIELMNALSLMPITNKTVLRTSKVLDRVEKWKNLDVEKKILSKEERKQAKAEKKKKAADGDIETLDSGVVKLDNADQGQSELANGSSDPAQSSSDIALQELLEMKMRVKAVASELLEKWEDLKEDFKIPKKQKQEIMIEHEREADNDDWDNDSTAQRTDVLSSDRYKNRFGDDHSFGATRGLSTHFSKKQHDPAVSKQQRRKMFEAKVLQIDTEKQMMMLHEKNCAIFGLNSNVTPPIDVPVRVNRVTGEYNTIDGRIAPPPPNHYQFKYEPLTLSTDANDYHLPHIDLPDHWKFALDVFGRVYFYHEKIRQPQWEAPIKILPINVHRETENESADSDESTTETEDSEEEELRELLEMLKRKKSLSPTQHPKAVNPLILCGDGEEDELEKKIMSNMMRNPLDQPLKLSQLSQKRLKKKKRQGLTTMKFIRPRSEADKIYGRTESKRYKEVKEKLRQKKRRIMKGEAGPADESSEDDNDSISLNDSTKSHRFVDELDILEKNEFERTKIEKKAKKNVTPMVLDPVEIKRQFRDDIKREISKYLQPYREETCEKGRITNETDFSNLINKLTYSVLTKELKHCQSTKTILKATDSVKGKTREYIKKYMCKFEGDYQRKEDEQDYANILNKF